MTIIVKNKHTLIFGDFKFKCCVGKNGFSKNKYEGDKKTPTGRYALGSLYFRKDRKKPPKTKLKVFEIRKNMGWCNDINSLNKYNKLINLNSKLKCERLFRHDYKYNFLIPIKYNWNKPKIGRGSAIFIHLTKNYKPTTGCIGLSEKDFLIVVKLLTKKTKIQIL